jgi:endonuclease IV
LYNTSPPPFFFKEEWKIAETINKINFPEGSKLLLENATGQGCYLATKFEEIKEIYDQIDKDNKNL